MTYVDSIIHGSSVVIHSTCFLMDRNYVGSAKNLHKIFTRYKGYVSMTFIWFISSGIMVSFLRKMSMGLDIICNVNYREKNVLIFFNRYNGHINDVVTAYTGNSSV